MPDKKNWVEIFLMPLVIAGVGILGTYLITQQQETNAIAKADSDRQVKILEIFAEKITDKDEKQRLLAIKLLRAVDDELAEKLASAVAETEPEKSDVKIAATKIADEAKARIEHKPRIYIHVSGNEEKNAAESVEKLLEDQGWIVPGIQRVGGRSPNSSQLRYFRRSEKPKAEEIHESLVNAGYDVSLNYISGYETSTAIRAMHFEIWFALGKPMPSTNNQK
jgi:hypothetical protein